MKHFTLLLLSATTAGAVFAQNPSTEYAPLAGNGSSPAGSNRAMFDIQLDVNPLTVAAGLAGCFYTGTEFWVSRWANDSIFILNSSGVETSNFTVAGVTGIRSITSDGTDIYVGCNTNTIYRIDKTTHALLGTITSSAPDASRYITYDPTLNGGAGGFWSGNFATNWTAISMTGAVLSSITAATHGLTGVYGLAYDGFSPGGPYLWAFDQGGNGADLHQYSITGTATGTTNDCTLDLQGGNTGIAGGICVVNSFMAGTVSLGGVNQGASIFMYEIVNFNSVNEVNGSVNNVNMFPNPANEQLQLTIDMNESSSVKVDIYNVAGAQVYNGNVAVMPAGKNNTNISLASFESGMYTVKITSGTGITTKQLSVVK